MIQRQGINMNISSRLRQNKALASLAKPAIATIVANTNLVYFICSLFSRLCMFRKSLSIHDGVTLVWK